ncbi:hypothetical protein BC940DRAFT_288757 [Gongronella butleri]|nr:hypothetical protein BC940DRAFT_288757 [Gongronella butleri]
MSSSSATSSPPPPANASLRDSVLHAPSSSPVSDEEKARFLHFVRSWTGGHWNGWHQPTYQLKQPPPFVMMDAATMSSRHYDTTSSMEWVGMAGPSSPLPIGTIGDRPPPPPQYHHHYHHPQNSHPAHQQPLHLSHPHHHPHHQAHHPPHHPHPHFGVSVI